MYTPTLSQGTDLSPALVLKTHVKNKADCKLPHPDLPYMALPDGHIGTCTKVYTAYQQQAVCIIRSVEVAETCAYQHQKDSYTHSHRAKPSPNVHSAKHRLH